MKPSNFTSFPLSSVLKSGSAEMVARNIMKILKRTGDTFRELSWLEYAEERRKDTGFTEREKPYFDKVIGFCSSGDKALLFCKDWYKEDVVLA